MYPVEKAEGTRREPKGGRRSLPASLSSLSRDWDLIQTTLPQRGGRDRFILQWTKKVPLWNFAWHGVPNMPLMKRLNRWTLRIGIRSRKKKIKKKYQQKGVASLATVGAERRKPY